MVIVSSVRSTEKTDRHPARIVLIEDNAVDIFLLRKALDAAGLHANVTILSEGDEAVSAVAHWTESTVPDLIVLDLNLPRRSGLEILRAIRGSARLADSLVVVLSSSDSPIERQALSELGVRDFFLKPFRYEAYLQLGRELSALVA
jgi:CheY-like chemotaxis protein